MTSVKSQVAVVCSWHRDPDIRQLERSFPTPQTSSIYAFLFVAAVIQREVTLGDLKSGPQGQLYASLPLGGISLADGDVQQAFNTGDPIKREQRLFVRMPDGVPGESREVRVQLLKIV